MALIHNVACAIFCAKEVCDDPAWSVWADNWLSGEDRSREAAQKSVWLKSTLPEVSLAASYAVFWYTAEGGLIHPTQVTDWLDIVIMETPPSIIMQVLTNHFICPHCYKQPDQHTKSGKCLFGAHTWESIGTVWQP